MYACPFPFEMLTLCLCQSDNTCVPQCPEGYYVKDQDERLCGRCHFSCKTCTGHHSVECVTCKPGFFKQGETCVETCSEGSGKKTKPCSQISGVVSHPLLKKIPWSKQISSFSFSVTLATQPPWCVSAVTRPVASVRVVVAETVWAAERAMSTWSSGASACRAALQDTTKSVIPWAVTSVTLPARPATVREACHVYLFILICIVAYFYPSRLMGNWAPLSRVDTELCELDKSRTTRKIFKLVKILHLLNILS